MTIAHTSRLGLVSVMLLMPSLVTMAGEPFLDLSGRSLALSDYRGRDLRGANLRKADLTMADFSGADLRGADVTDAKLDRVNLDGADLRGVIGWAKADLGLGLSANRANFAGTDLRNAKVAGGYSGGYFEKADFTQTDLTGATLAGRFHGARFEGATLRGALMLGAGGVESIREDLRKRGAIVVGEDFAAAVKSGRDFSHSLLQGAQLQDLNLTALRVQGADLHSANFDRTVLDGADLRGAALYWATAIQARFDGADLTDAQFDNVRADDASFVGAKLVHASLLGTHLPRANLRNVDLIGADLSYADLTGADLTGAILDDVEIEAAIFNGVRGLSAETCRALRGRAGRWRYDLEMAVNEFLEDWSFPVHLMLTPLALVLGLGGRQTTAARGSFTVLMGINAAALLPLLLVLGMGLLGGSPVAQLSVSNMGLWEAWFHAWPVLILVMAALLLGSLICGGFHIVRYVIMPPRNAALLSLCCVLVTVANCFFAAQVLFLMAPDA